MNITQLAASTTAAAAAGCGSGEWMAAACGFDGGYDVRGFADVGFTPLLLRRDEAIALAAAVALIMLITVAGNLLVIVAVATHESLGSQPSSGLIVNLAAADLASALLVMPLSEAALSVAAARSDVDSSAPGTTWCSVQCAANYCLVVATMLTLCYIAVDRYLHVAHPFWYARRVTPGLWRFLVAWSWLEGGAVALAPIGLGWVHYDRALLACDVDWARSEAVAFGAAVFALCFVAPAAVIALCYARIFAAIRRSGWTAGLSDQRRRSSGQSLSGVGIGLVGARRQSTSQVMAVVLYHRDGYHAHLAASSGCGDVQAAATATDLDADAAVSVRLLPAHGHHWAQSLHQKAAYSLAVVVAAFFMCMTPFCLTELMKALLVEVPVGASTAATVLQYASSAINPFIYGLLHRDFRRAFCLIRKRLSRRWNTLGNSGSGVCYG